MKKELIKKYGQLYSELLDINIKSKKEKEIFKWFLASYLMGKRITEGIALRTYRVFEKHGLVTPEKISKTSWKRLVKILGEGHYVRYDESTASRLLLLSKQLKKKYGSLTNLYKKSKDLEDLKNKLQEFRGVGDVTVNIFLRELRLIWPKAKDLEYSELVKIAVKKLRINLDKIKKDSDFLRLEVALVRVGKLIRKGKL